MLGRKKKETTSDGLTFQISHQAISCITCKSIQVRFQIMDKTMASFFCENSISFNADSAWLIQFCTHDGREHEISQTKSFWSYKPFPANCYLGSSLTKHAGQLSNLQFLFLLLLKSWEQLAISEQGHQVQRTAAVENHCATAKTSKCE